MPIYEYKCNICGKKFELLLDMPLTIEKKVEQKYMRCPYCKKIGVKVPSIVHFILKGPGFHGNDYKKGKK